MAAELTHEEVRKWAARVRREASRNPRFEREAPHTWVEVGELAHAIWKAGNRENDREVLSDLATDVLMVELKARNLPMKPRSEYRAAVWLYFRNYGAFWHERPLLHAVGELSWIIDEAQANLKDTADYMDLKISCAALWRLPYSGHYK